MKSISDDNKKVFDSAVGKDGDFGFDKSRWKAKALYYAGVAKKGSDEGQLLKKIESGLKSKKAITLLHKEEHFAAVLYARVNGKNFSVHTRITDDSVDVVVDDFVPPAWGEKLRQKDKGKSEHLAGRLISVIGDQS